MAAEVRHQIREATFGLQADPARGHVTLEVGETRVVMTAREAAGLALALSRVAQDAIRRPTAIQDTAEPIEAA